MFIQKLEIQEPSLLCLSGAWQEGLAAGILEEVITEVFTIIINPVLSVLKYFLLYKSLK